MIPNAQNVRSNVYASKTFSDSIPNSKMILGAKWSSFSDPVRFTTERGIMGDVQSVYQAALCSFGCG